MIRGGGKLIAASMIGGGGTFLAKHLLLNQHGGIGVGGLFNKMLVANIITTGKFEPIKVKYTKGQKVKWCACGLSDKQPHCDGSHTTTNITPIEFDAPETKEYYMCVCKRSGKRPYCDGTHKKLNKD